MYSRHAFGWASCLGLVAAGITPLDPAIRIRNAPGASNADTYRAVGRALYETRAEQGTVAFDANVTLDRSWNDAVLFAYEAAADATPNVEVEGSIEITCTTCYIKGLAKAQLTIADGFDAGTILQKTIDNVHDQVENLTDKVEDHFQQYVSGVVTKLSDGFDADDFAFPTFPFAFDIDVPAIPQCDLLFTFDGMEMYIALETSLSLGATYTLNLFSSNTPLGISVGKNLRAGLVFTLDLILMVEGSIDISNGFHIKLDDGVSIHIPLFDDKVGSIAFNGGQFEFLPVTIESAGIVLSAILRVGAQFGLEIVTPLVPPPLPSMSGGIEVGIFANVAEFVTNVTVAPKDDECELRVVQGYQFAIGAAAGATVAIAKEEYGPAVETSVPIFYTEIADVCAIKGKPTPTLTPTAAVTPRADALRRADLTTTTISTAVKYTGVACVQPTLVNCPVSLQTTTQYTVTKTLVTSVSSGQDATFPESTSTGAPSTIVFGSNVQKLTATSGAPVSYVPPAPTDVGTENNDDDDHSTKDKLLKGEVKGVKKSVIIGASIGGAILLIAVIVGLFCWCSKRRNHKPMPLKGNKDERYEMMRGIPDNGAYGQQGGQEMYSDLSYTGSKQPAIAVTSYH
ncbi:hypothetical protein K505DRAFT_373905 [Melanomma pulvis-pyrius CBS 109.77]|uniref:Mid2 domain-containing protein n=1 Tax=Melanomma pulvis-pyrius CBS 109.77 TaxID=1314802 RepID=A0A6A6XFR6_9PLEO|nr:hypothetical protein K505DRAFT_373905 [Melanomma pulvis-pyrius CBS 109.77]